MSEKNVQIKYRTDAGIYDDIYPKTKSDIIETSDGEPIEDKINRLSDYTDTKVDKEKGKQLSSHDFTKSERDKLSGIEDGANKYVHPDTHPASMIEQSTSRQFVRDTDKNKWDNKQDKLEYIPENKSDKGKVNGYAELDSDAQVPIRQLPDLSNTRTYVVKNKSERTHLKDINEGDKAYETVTGNNYIWGGSKWEFLNNTDKPSLEWSNVEGRPSHSVKEIDKSVSNSHSHDNKNTLDDISEDKNGNLQYKGESINTNGVTKKEFSHHKNDTNNPHDVTAEQVGAETPEGSQSKANSALSDAKSYTDSEIKKLDEPSLEGYATEEYVDNNVFSGNYKDLNGRPNIPSEARDIGAETLKGAQNKADKAESNAKSYTDDEIDRINKNIESGVSAVNNKTGDVKLDSSDVNLKNVTNDKQATKKEFNTHTNDMNNPHNVTASQTGAITSEDAQNKADKAESNAKSYTDTEIKKVNGFSGNYSDLTGKPFIPSTASDVGLGNVTNDKQATRIDFDDHKNDSNNPHNVTTEQIGAEDTSNKSSSGGYASLDSNAKIPLSELPDLSNNQTYVVSDSSEREGLSDLNEGDGAYETSTGDSYIWDGKEWQIAAKADWENVKLDWGNIKNLPSKFTPESHNHDIKDVNGLQSLLDDKETPSGAKSKADTAESNAKSYTDNKIESSVTRIQTSSTKPKKEDNVDFWYEVL